MFVVKTLLFYYLFNIIIYNVLIFINYTMYLYIYLPNLFYYFILYQYMCITSNVYIDSYIVQHHIILLYKYGAI